MKIKFTITGDHAREPMGWPEDWPVPSEGQPVMLSGGDTVYVRTVHWFPYGDTEDGGDLDPFVYVVLGPRRQAVEEGTGQ